MLLLQQTPFAQCLIRGDHGPPAPERIEAHSTHESDRYSAIALEDAAKLPIYPTTSRANVADFLLHSAVEGPFVRQIAVVTDAR